MGTVMISLAVLTLFVVPLSGVRGEVHGLRVDIAAYEGTDADAAEVMDRYLSRRWLTEARSLRFGETLSYRYRVVFKDKEKLEAMLRELSGIEGIERVVLETEDAGGEGN